jgi:hypothetical protein
MIIASLLRPFLNIKIEYPKRKRQYNKQMKCGVYARGPLTISPFSPYEKTRSVKRARVVIKRLITAGITSRCFFGFFIFLRAI